MSQCDVLLERMLAGETITPARAYELTGSLACHSRMAELRNRGYRVECVMRTDGPKRWGEYRILRKPEQQALDLVGVYMPAGSRL